MTWLVLSIILGIGAIAAFSIGSGAETTAGQKLAGKGAGSLCIVAWAILTFFICLHKVGQTETGVVYNFSGTIAGQKSPGIVTTWPWQHVKTEIIAVQKEAFEFGDANAAVSKDQQPITAQIVVNYQVAPTDVVELFKSVGPNWKNVLLDGRVPQDFKETTATFTSPQITQERPQLRQQTLARLQKEMCPQSAKEPWCVKIVDVFISNVGYSKAYTDAIEAKQVQVQQAQQAEAKVKQSQAEARQAEAVAAGVANSNLIEARAEAKALSLKGEALRKHPDILRLEAIDKLNPAASVIICTGTGDNNCPSFLPAATPGSGK